MSVLYAAAGLLAVAILETPDWHSEQMRQRASTEPDQTEEDLQPHSRRSPMESAT